MHWNGSAWAPSTLTNAQVRFIDANAADDVWVIGNDAASPGIGLIGHFDGTTWTTWRTPQETYNNIASTAPNDTWVAGADGTMRHWDGVGWLSTNNIGASPSGLAAVSGLMAFNANEVIAVSTLNLAYRYRGQSFGRFPNLPFPDPFAASVHRGMWGTSADNVWVTTVKGEIFHYNGTAPWTLSTVVDPGLTIAANGVWGTSASDVWVAAQDGRVLQRSGTTWTSHALSPGLAIQEIWSTSPTDVWAFGTGGAFHYNGTTWTRFVLSNTLVHGAHGSGPDDLYVVTAPDTAGHALWHWDGTAWSAVTTLVASTKLNNVFAIAPNLVFVVANNGHIHGWNGTAWRDDLLEATAELKFLSGSAIDDVVAASERELFHWDGRQWSAMRPPIDFVPNTLDYLPMVDLLVSPGRIDMLLQRFRVRTLLRTRPLHCRPNEDSCTDAVDNDCDGKVDSADDQCP
ncbi:MAG: hypothetical protein JWP01_1201 [Myxococcales bacterium]|nr:hypothetical protein [Myxococcales bacterium]